MENEDQTQEQLKESLLKLATGYEVTEKEAVRGKNGKEEKIKVKKRHVPPDIKAIKEVRRLIALGKW